MDVKCPYCLKIRNVNIKRSSKTTLCRSCSQSVIVGYFKSDDGEYSYFFVKNKDRYEKILIDNDTADELKNNRFSFGLSSDEGYVSITGLGVRLHNFIMEHIFDESKHVVDHINNNIYDNRKANLRIVSQTLNQANKKNQKNNTSGFKAIIKTQSGWRVQIRKNRIFLLNKRFKDFANAFKHFKEVVLENYGEYYYNILEDDKINMRYSGIIKDDVANGAGVGLVLFSQFCSIRCENCQNKHTWDKDGGEKFTKEIFNDIIEYFKINPLANRLTLSGGEIFDNMQLANHVASEFKYAFPEKKIWVYTGYTYEDLLVDTRNAALLEMTDVLIDGRFEENKKNITLPYRGSSNQRIIDVKESLKQKKTVLLEI